MEFLLSHLISRNESTGSHALWLFSVVLPFISRNLTPFFSQGCCPGLIWCLHQANSRIISYITQISKENTHKTKFTPMFKCFARLGKTSLKDLGTLVSFHVWHEERIIVQTANSVFVNILLCDRSKRCLAHVSSRIIVVFSCH